MNSLQDYSVIDLMPNSLKVDPFIIVLAEAIEIQLKQAFQEAETLANFSDVDNLPEILLDYLAHQKHVDYYENDSPIQQKRGLIKNHLLWHQKKGTPWAVESAVNTVFGDIKLSEWFEYGGSPYSFKIDIQLTTIGPTEQTINLVEKLINSYKNKRSWLDSINLYLTSNAKQYLASFMNFGEEITVYPWSQKQLETKGRYILGTASQSVETLAVYPQ